MDYSNWLQLAKEAITMTKELSTAKVFLLTFTVLGVVALIQAPDIIRAIAEF